MARDCDDSVKCQTLIFDTSSEKIFKFRFVVMSNAQPGFEKLTTQILTQRIVCGGEVQTVSSSLITYVFDKNSGTKIIDFSKDEIRKIFSSNIKACDVTRFDLFEEDHLLWNNPSIEMFNKNKTDET